MLKWLLVPAFLFAAISTHSYAQDSRELEEKIKNCDAKLESLNKELSKLKFEMDAINIDDVKNERDSLKLGNADLEKERKRLRLTSDRLNSENSRLKAQLSQLKASKKIDSDEEVKSLEANIDRLKAEMEILRNQNDSFRGANASADKLELERSRSEASRLKKLNMSLQKNIAKLKAGKNVDTNVEIANLKEQLRLIKVEMDLLSDQNKALRVSNEKLAGPDSPASKMRELKLELAKLEDENSKLKARYSELQIQTDKLKDPALRDLEAEKLKIENANTKLKDANRRITEKIAELESRMGALKGVYEKFQKLQEQRDRLEAARKNRDKLEDLRGGDHKQRAATAIADTLGSTKFIDLSFGVLPNTDKKVNNYAHFGINYNPSFTTSLTYYTRNMATDKTSQTKTESIGSEMTITSEDQTSIRITELEFKLVEWKPTPWTIGNGKMQLALNFGMNQLNDTRESRQITRQTFADPSSGKERQVLMNDQIDQTLVAFMPRIGTNMKYRLGGLKLKAGGGIFIGNQELMNYRQKGTSNIPALSKSADVNGEEIPSQLIEVSQNNDIKSTSNGFSAETEILYEGKRHGFGVHGSIRAQKGDKQTYESELFPQTPVFDSDGNQTNEGAIVSDVREVDIEEERYSLAFGVSYKLNFLGPLAGVIPTFRVNYINDVVNQQANGVTTTESTKIYDLGMIFDMGVGDIPQCDCNQK